MAQEREDLEAWHSLSRLSVGSRFCSAEKLFALFRNIHINGNLNLYIQFGSANSPTVFFGYKCVLVEDLIAYFKMNIKKVIYNRGFCCTAYTLPGSEEMPYSEC